jgi:colanic acid/amylovoran biosynthesis glycosyltransferase
VKRVALVVSRYPSLSHTFIRREVEGLRALGVEIEAVTIRASEDALLTEADRAEAALTRILVPASTLSVVGALASELARSPRRFFRTLGQAVRHRAPGLRSRGYGIIYFTEAVLLAHDLRGRDVGHVHAHFANVGGEVALHTSRLLETGYSLSLHGHSDFSHADTNGLREKIAAASFVVCVSEFGRQAARALAGPGGETPLHVIRCGVAKEMLALEGSPPKADGLLHLLTVGRLAPEKAQGLLLEAFATARERGLEARLRIVGEGPERPRLEARIQELGLADCCTLVGALGGADVDAEYEAAHAFVLSSRVEGLPVTLMEAFAHALPAVAPRLAGIPELVGDGESGWLFETGDGEDLARALLDLANDDAERRVRGARGRERVRALHDASRNAGELRDLFAAALADG